MGTSKTLLLVRHAKSDWSQPGLRDHDRPLNDKGRKDAPVVAKFLDEVIKTPDLLLSSTARRALETATIMAEYLNYPPDDILRIESLYGTDVAEYLKQVSAIDEKIKTAMIFGHNPIMEETVSTLCSGKSMTVHLHMSTCSVACLSLTGDSWQRAGPATFELQWLINPKILNRKKK